MSNYGLDDRQATITAEEDLEESIRVLGLCLSGEFIRRDTLRYVITSGLDDRDMHTNNHRYKVFLDRAKRVARREALEQQLQTRCREVSRVWHENFNPNHCRLVRRQHATTSYLFIDPVAALQKAWKGLKQLVPTSWTELRSTIAQFQGVDL